MTGRVFGIQSTILSGVMIGAPLLGGMLVQAAGPSVIFFNFGIVIALIGVLGIMFGRMLWPTEIEKADSLVEQSKKVEVLET